MLQQHVELLVFQEVKPINSELKPMILMVRHQYIVDIGIFQEKLYN